MGLCGHAVLARFPFEKQLMRSVQRKSAPKVAAGRVQKKNNWDLTPNYYSHAQPRVLIDRKRPGAGFRHLLRQKDLVDFIGILPDWEHLSQGLDALVLAPGRRYSYGYHTPGVVHIRAWNADLWVDCSAEYYERDRYYFDRLRIPCEEQGEGVYLCKFTVETARAYQLLNVLLHELGHHHDLMTTKAQKQASRGEGYADKYAELHSAHIWLRYQEEFGLE